MRNAALLLAAAELLATGASAQLQNSSKAHDESEPRSIEAENAKFEQQNDVSRMTFLADDWIALGPKLLTKSELQENEKRNLASRDNGPNPYTIKKKNMRVDLFGDTAVVTYIKEYRQQADATKFFDEDDTDVFTRSAKGWRRLTKISPIPAETKSHWLATGELWQE